MSNDVRNLDAVLATFGEPWSPRTAAAVNDHDVKLARLEGEFVWHAHPDSDELFLVLDGEVTIRLRERGEPGAERDVPLGRHDVFVVPRGVEHCPVSETGATVLLLERRATLSTGDYAGEVPDRIHATEGVPLEAPER